jgi:uncharacterized protein (DUF1684 family)
MVSGSYAAALIGWREAVAEIYRTVRETHRQGAERAWRRFRSERDALYARHPCSALTDAEKLRFESFENFPYDPELCFVGEVAYGGEEMSHAVPISEGVLPCRRIGEARFEFRGRRHSLSLFWLDIYGGGLWLPVGDETNGDTSYGGGRYLFDTAKGANLGFSGDGRKILLDMNFLYPPSCALNSQWVCPLCPPENRLPFRIEAGETNEIAWSARAALRAV